MTPHLQTFLEWWYLAKAECLGIYIRTTNYNLLMSKLYLARTAADDPSLSTLQVRRSPRDPQGELWIVNVPDADPTAVDLSTLMRA